MSKSSLPQLTLPHQTLQSKTEVREALRRALEDMEFAAFECIMKSLLYKSGYLSVHLIGRNTKRGRTNNGGLDLTARSVTELSSALTIAQVKQYKRVVSRRFVDELRGAMLRTGAEQGLLLTISRFSKVAHVAAEESKVAPIKLIEGNEILDLLFAYRIGVRESKGVWRLDEKYLDFLQERAIGTYRRPRTEKPHMKNERFSNAGPSTIIADLPSNSLNNQTHDLQPNQPKPIAIPLEAWSGIEEWNAIAELGERGEMTWSTHLMAGLNALWLLEVLPGHQTENIALMAGAAAFGSLLPDLDASQSKIKHLRVGGIKPFYLPAAVIHHQLGHRTFLHSLLGLAFVGIIGVVLAPFIGWRVALALWLGYGSHLVADGVTKSGIPLLYPRPKRFHLLPKGFRLTTGSLAEEAVFVLLSLCALALLLRHLGL